MQGQNKWNMKYLVLALVLISCGSKPSVRESKGRVVAVYTGLDSKKYVDILYREINIVSTDGTVDTLWGVPKFAPELDSSGNAKTDSSGNVIYGKVPKYFKIGKDSVNWRIEGKDIDQLLK
jgi:hypothetical protein